MKQCSRRFPIEFLGNTTLPRRGSRSVLASIDKETGETELVAISWVHRNRRFFMTTTCGIREGEDVFRKRLGQMDKSGRAPPDTVIIEVAQPKAIATYYKGAGTIDWHNRIRADELRMDRNLATKYEDLNLVFANHREEDEIYPLTIIEIAKAQKKDRNIKIYYKRNAKTPEKGIHQSAL